MSLDIVLGRIDEILACQQELNSPGSVVATSSSSSGFAAQLSSAQAALAPGTTLTGSDATSTGAPASSTAGGLPTSLAQAGGGTPTALSVAARMLAAAHAAVGGAYNQGNHDAVSDTAGQILQQGTDCSGFVSYLMGPNGIGDWSQSYCTPGIPTAPDMQPGKGSYVTIWNNPNPGNAGHVWIEILGQYFESAGSTGVHQMDPSEVNMYLNSGDYQPFHPAGM
jgi:hypothetical protein